MVKLKVTTFRIKHRGIFDMNGLFKTMRKWLFDQGYEMHEKSYKHKVPVPTGAEQEFEWWAWKRVNNYVKFHFEIFIRIYDLKQVEVIREGKKKTLTQGSLLMELAPSIEIDYQNRFGGSKLMQSLHDFYVKYVMNYPIDLKWGDEIYYRMLKLQTVIKEYLNFETKTNAYQDMW